MRTTLMGMLVAAAMVPTANADPVDARTAGETGHAVVAAAGEDFRPSAASLRRVRRALTVRTERITTDARPLAVDFQVQVVAAGPAAVHIAAEDLVPGAAIAYGPPLHEDFRALWSPWPAGRSMAGAPHARTGFRVTWSSW